MKKNYATKILTALTFFFFLLDYNETTTCTGAYWDNGVPTFLLVLAQFWLTQKLKV